MTDAITREEKLLVGVAIEPITREEMFLAKLAGQDVQTPEPITRKEKLLNEAIKGISGGGGTESGGGGVGIILSDFTGGIYKLPKVADMRGLSDLMELFPIDSPSAMQNILAYIFSNRTNKVNNGGLFAQLKEVYLPDKVTYIGDSMFKNCTLLETIQGDTNYIVVIGPNAFTGCTSLKTLPYMPNLKSTNIQAFKDCTGLTEFKFYKTPNDTNGESIASNTFVNCTNLLDIYVPWSEGEVSNAPWGATNATIHYNTVYDENHEPIV